MRLGFAVKMLGRTGLKSNDSRRWQNGPHLRVSIEYCHAIFDYLEEAGISMYRISSDFAPYLTHPDLPRFHNQLEEARCDLYELGRHAASLNLRLSFHPSQYIVLNSPNERTVEGAIKDFNAQARMLDYMEQGDEAVVVTHVGGVYGDRDVARARFIENYGRLPEPARRRLVLENDDVSWGVDDVLRIHEATGIRCIFDHQHHNCFNPSGMDIVDACRQMLATWPASGPRPKIHFSSPRIEPRLVNARDRATSKRIQRESPPLPTQHADYIDTDVYLPFIENFRQELADGHWDTPFDTMCEAKAKDLAVLQLRTQLRERAPALLLR